MWSCWCASNMDPGPLSFSRARSLALSLSQQPSFHTTFISLAVLFLRAEAADRFQESVLSSCCNWTASEGACVPSWEW